MQRLLLIRQEFVMIGVRGKLHDVFLHSLRLATSRRRHVILWHYKYGQRLCLERSGPRRAQARSLSSQFEDVSPQFS